MTQAPATRQLALAAGLVLGAACAGLLAAALTAAPARAADGETGFSAGFQVTKSASAQDMGLPVYPGSVPRPKEGKDGDDSAATVGMHWGSLFGLTVQVLKFRSAGPVADVAGYYRDALARHGAVLDCSHGVPRAPAPPKGDDTTLRCDSDGAKPGEFVFKTGTQRHQRVVAVRPAPQGADFDLVRVEVRGG
jgi:hypothetical protein